MKEVPTVPSLALKTLDIALKALENLSFSLVKFQIAVLLGKNCAKLIVIFSKFISFFLEKTYKMMLHLAVTFQRYQIC